ncbi:MAG: ABC transporter ATP-binding protein [Acidobacteriota bacterium]|nr:MAG: ABC transporter ATP-binding protein [Acidobacteriota bacterium]
MKFLEHWKRALAIVWSSAPGFTAVWAIFLLVQGVLPVAFVYLTKIVIDSIVAANAGGGKWDDVGEAVFYLVVMGGTLLVAEVVKHLGVWIRAAQAESIADSISDMVHRQAVRLDIVNYETPEYHDLMERARGESSGKPLELLESLGGSIRDGITVLAFAAILFSYAWWLPAVVILGAVPSLIVAYRLDRDYHRWWKASSNERRWASYYDAMLVHSDAAAEIRVFDLGRHFRNLYQGVRQKIRAEKLRHLRRQGTSRIAAGAFALVTAGGAVAWMAYRVLYGFASLGDLGVFYQIFSRGQSLVGSLLGSAGTVANNSLYLENLFDFLDLEPKIVGPEKPAPIFDRVSRSIEFRNVEFSYPGSTRPALSDFDLELPANKVTALVGVNGAGKSTAVKLLLRFYDPDRGSVLIDGTDIRNFDPVELRRRASVLFQFPMQYHARAGESIALGAADIETDTERVLESSANAGAHEFISRLPEGYETLLGKWFVDGAELSGGEWQRLALARAFYRRAPIVLLDEPTSFMDSWSEADWFERLRSMTERKTGLLITHRFSIAKRADVIHVIDRGRIVESGSHSELVRSGGAYAASWDEQMRLDGERINYGT